MIYFVPRFNGLMAGSKTITFKKDVKYLVEDVKDEFMFVYNDNGEQAYVVNFAWLIEKKEHNYAFVATVEHDTYIFLLPSRKITPMFTSLKYKNKEVTISCGDSLVVTYDGATLNNTRVEDVSYSHFSVVGEYCVLYFVGKRYYVVVLNGEEVKFSDYYDEVNVEKEDIYFLTKLYDSLNHGKVCAIKDKKFESYLVYLDNEEMNLKQEFCATVFLDAVRAGNLKYCNNLLADSIKQTDEKQIASFLPKFDDFYPCSENSVVLINKNTLAGICKFEVENNKIENIITL